MAGLANILHINGSFLSAPFTPNQLPITDPWDWYIYLHENHKKSTIHVGKNIAIPI